MNIISITGLCIITTIICKLLDRNSKEYTYLIVLGSVSFILLMVISYLTPVISAVESLFNITGISEEYLQIIFKAIGICYLTQLGCDFCKDSGESALASELELAGKIALLIIALPLFSDLLNIVKQLITL